MRLRGSFKTSYRVVYFTRFWERGWESICQNPLLLQLSSPGLYKRVFTRVIFSLVSWLPLTFWTQKNRDREREIRPSFRERNTGFQRGKAIWIGGVGCVFGGGSPWKANQRWFSSQRWSGLALLALCSLLSLYSSICSLLDTPRMAFLTTSLPSLSSLGDPFLRMQIFPEL